MAEKTSDQELKSKALDPQTNTFEFLSSIDMSPYVEKTLQKHNYVSWVHAVEKMMKLYDASFSWQVHEDPNTGAPFFQTPWGGAMVKVSTYVLGAERTQWHPVITHTNKPIVNPDVMAINNAIQRCLAKCIALHGLGLYIYAGEDLPPTMENPDREPEAQEQPKKRPTEQEGKARLKTGTPEGNKATVEAWINRAVEKGLSSEEAWILFEAARLASGTINTEYTLLNENDLSKTLSSFAESVKENIEKRKEKNDTNS